MRRISGRLSNLSRPTQTCGGLEARSDLSLRKIRFLRYEGVSLCYVYVKAVFRITAHSSQICSLRKTPIVFL